MNQRKRYSGNKKLRHFRIFSAVAVFFCFLYVFLGSGPHRQILADGLLWFQFAPSAIRFFYSAILPTSCGFLVVLLLTLLWGRLYCSVLCPLGLWQDLIIFLKRRLSGSNKGCYSYRKASLGIRYVIFSCVILSAIWGLVSVLNFLEPYSIFGRIVSLIIKPVILVIKNGLAALLNRCDLHWLRVETISPIPWVVLGVTLVFVVGITALSLWRGRYYCNTLCPVGTILGWINRISFLKVRIRPEACTACGRCERICPAECIDAAAKAIDSSRCISCFDCLAVCPASAVVYGRISGKEKNIQTDPSRRRLISGAVLSGGVLALLPLSLPTADRMQDGSSPVMPPGTGNDKRFCDLCVGCGLCVSICPEGVLRSSLYDYGLKGLLMPVMDYRQGYCSYTCNLCGQVCPTGAIQKWTLSEKQQVQMGKAHLVESRCVVHSKHEDCGACAEACPTRAVYTIKHDNVLYPYTNTDLCTGCGACEHMCPVSPKAIIVAGSSQQGRVPKSASQTPSEPAKPISTVQDFPF